MSRWSSRSCAMPTLAGNTHCGETKMTSDTGAIRLLYLAMLIIATGSFSWVTSVVRYGSPMHGRPASLSLQARGLRRITLLVPVGRAEGLLLLARELRARQRAGTARVASGWRRLSPSAELFIDLDSGARCAVRDTGALGAERYYWIVSAFGDHQVAEGRTGELTEARSQAEAACGLHGRPARAAER